MYLDVGHEDEGNIDYIVMEYVSGKTLKDLIVFNGKLNYDYSNRNCNPNSKSIRLCS